MRPATVPDIWIAQLHVRPMPGHDGGLDGGAGAYAVVLALAEDGARYREMVVAEMQTLGLVVVEITGSEPYDPNDYEGVVSDCAKQISAEWPIQYRDFHIYPHDDA